MAANQAVRLAELGLDSETRLSEMIVRATGRITSATCDTLESTMRELIPEFKRVVLDISNVDYIDDSGLRVLVNVYMHARKTDCDLEIANPKQHLRDILRSWLHSAFEGHEEFLGMTPD